MRALAVLIALAASPLLAEDTAPEIAGARYVRATDAYGHGAVKDGEYEGLQIRFSDGNVAEVHMRSGVFEDTAPRLFDFDKDGVPEIVTVFSTNVGGAMVQLWKITGHQLIPAGHSRPIGRRHRWLAIAGIADFDGDGQAEIAYVDRPHLNKELVLLRVGLDGAKASWSELARKPGLTNHHLGADVIEGGVRDCAGELPVILTADADWRNVVETRYEAGRLQPTPVAPYAGSESLAAYLTCE